MEAMDSCSSCNYEEVALEQTLLFSDSLKDLKKLRSQLYSAADYFEVSYTDGDQKRIVVNTLRDYTINALVSTVDHLGSVTYKITGLLDEKADEVTGTELRVACIEQRLRTCQVCVDHEGLSQQSLAMRAPKFHKRYILPGKHVEETVHCSEHNVSKYQGCCFENDDNRNHSMNAVQTLIRDAQPSTVRKDPSPSPRPFVRPGSFSFTEKRNKPKVTEKRSMSPLRSVLPLLRTGSLLSRSSTPRSSRLTTPTSSRPRASTPSRPTTPTSDKPRASASSRPTTPTSGKPRASASSRPTPPTSGKPRASASSMPTTPASSTPRDSTSSRPTTPTSTRLGASTRPITPASSRPISPPTAFTQTRLTTPNAFNRRSQVLSETRKPPPIRLRSERNHQDDTEQYATKTKRLFKALLSRQKAKHDDTLYTYLDEY